MDTLFRLVSLQSSDQQSSFNSSRTSSSSRSSKTNHHFFHHSFKNQEEEKYGEECGNNYHLYMDEDFSSSCSSKHLHPHRSTATPAAIQTPSTAATAHVLFELADFSFPPELNIDLLPFYHLENQ